MTTRYEEIPLTKIELHPNNVRVDVGDVTELAASIEAKGILQPLLVAPHPTARTKFVVLAGHRRHAASKQAKLKVVPCTVREDLDTTQVQLEAMLVENLQRTDLNAVEEATAYQTLMEFPDYDAKRIAKATGRSQRLVNSRLKLTGLSPEGKQGVAAGQITLEQAEVLLEFAEDDEATEDLLRVTGTNDWNFMVARLRRRRDLPLKLAAVDGQLEGTNAKKIPDDGRYNGKWLTVRDELSPAEHVAAGHRFHIDQNYGELSWYKPVPKAKAPVLSDEEKAEKKREADFKASLQIAAEVRAEHIKSKIRNPPPEAHHRALVSLVSYREHQLGKVAELIGIPSDVDPAIIVEQLFHMSNDQLAIILHYLDSGYRDAELMHPGGWEPGGWQGQYTQRWLEDLQNVYGYQLSDIEKEVKDHYQARYEERQAATAELIAAADRARDEPDEGSDDDTDAENEWGAGCQRCDWVTREEGYATRKEAMAALADHEAEEHTRPDEEGSDDEDA